MDESRVWNESRVQVVDESRVWNESRVQGCAVSLYGVPRESERSRYICCAAPCRFVVRHERFRFVVRHERCRFMVRHERAPCRYVLRLSRHERLAIGCATRERIVWVTGRCATTVHSEVHHDRGTGRCATAQGGAPRQSASLGRHKRACVFGAQGEWGERPLGTVSPRATPLLTILLIWVQGESVLAGAGAPARYVVYHEMVLTGSLRLHCSTAVEPAWLARYGPRIYALGRSS